MKVAFVFLLIASSIIVHDLYTNKEIILQMTSVASIKEGNCFNYLLGKNCERVAMSIVETTRCTFFSCDKIYLKESPEEIKLLLKGGTNERLCRMGN